MKNNFGASSPFRSSCLPERSARGAKTKDEERVSAQHDTFSLFQNFPDLHFGLFGKNENFSSDLQCAEDLGFETIAKLDQVHGNQIHIIRKSNSGILKGDGMMTDVPGLALSIRFADCQAFAITAPKKNVIGVVHAGWRGMAAQVITTFYKKLKEEFATPPQETFVFAGPSICFQCSEFWNPTHELPEHMHEFIEGRYVDLQKSADAELNALGVPSNQQERHPACTKCSKEFWSYRGGDRNERNYLVVGLLPPMSS